MRWAARASGDRGGRPGPRVGVGAAIAPGSRTQVCGRADAGPDVSPPRWGGVGDEELGARRSGFGQGECRHAEGVALGLAHVERVLHVAQGAALA